MNEVIGLSGQLVMEELEKKIKKKLPYDIFYYRYVDDTLICLPENKVEDILCRFNSIDKKLKFTLDKSINNSINFLDINIQVIDNKIKLIGTKNQFGRVDISIFSLTTV